MSLLTAPFWGVLKSELKESQAYSVPLESFVLFPSKSKILAARDRRPTACSATFVEGNQAEVAARFRDYCLALAHSGAMLAALVFFWSSESALLDNFEKQHAVV